MRRRALLEPVSAAVVGTVRAAVAHRLWLSAIGQLSLVVIGVAYLVFGALRIAPFEDKLTVRVQLPESGGLLANQDVTLRGVPIGRVQSVDISGDGVIATARIDADTRIPLQGTTVHVSGLSPAGEQYLNFEPTTSDGALVTDGTLIGQDQTVIPIPMWRLLSDIDGVLAQANPEQLRAVMDELGVSEEGPDKLRGLLDGTQLLVSTLDGVLPETTSLIRGSRSVFQIIDDSSDGMHAMADNLGATMTGIAERDGGVRHLLDSTPAVLQTMDTLIADNSPTMVQLLGNLTTVAQLSYVRVPALDRLFNDERKPMLDGVASLMHEGGIWAIASIYPRYLCDYPHQRDVPFIPNHPEPFMYTYCQNDDPGVMVRGARNAPRPAGDDTALPPADLDPQRRTDPTPITDHTIPLPYGGPVMPPQSEPTRPPNPY
ncbi:MlaD family protein [Mycolicibacterium sp. XJ870]